MIGFRREDGIADMVGHFGKVAHSTGSRDPSPGRNQGFGGGLGKTTTGPGAVTPGGT
jgi:hypothetical protein